MNYEINEDEKVPCFKEYRDSCLRCVFRTYEMAGHPGGESHCLVEKSKCELGHWEDNF